jgi:protein SCO1/2
MTAERHLALKLAAGLGALAFAAASLSGCSEPKARFNAMDVTDAPWGQGFSLPDLQGNTVTHASFQGKVTAVFFGFMYCPDACPTHLTKMGEVKKLLGNNVDKVQLVFITLDPERDLPEKLSQYLQSFDPTIVGLRGSIAQTQALAKDFRVFYKKVDTKDSNKDPMAYTIDHTTFTYVFDGQGKLRLVIPHDLPAEKIASDFQHLISR